MKCPTCHGSGLHPLWGSPFCPFPECPRCGGEPPEEDPQPWVCHDCGKNQPGRIAPTWVIEHNGLEVMLCPRCDVPDGKAGAV